LTCAKFSHHHRWYMRVRKYNSIQLNPIFNERVYWFSLGGRSGSPPSMGKLLFLCSFGVVLPCYISWLCLAWQKSNSCEFEKNSLYQLQFHWSLSLRIKLITLAKIGIHLDPKHQSWWVSFELMCQLWLLIVATKSHWHGKILKLSLH